jgi:hypothetical protein
MKMDILIFISYTQKSETITKQLSLELIEDILISQIRGIVYKWHLKHGNYDMIADVKKQLEVILNPLIE